MDVDYLTGTKDFSSACITVKMSLMAGRTTTRVEDIAYSMFGIFGVDMNIRYHDGTMAFMRLQHQLMAAPNIPRDESLFACRNQIGCQNQMPAPRLLGADQEIPWQAGEWTLLAPLPNGSRSPAA
ncbi:hypothetical protein F4801DRAFT_584492 [Xylaria longipes]|nr:hypothetical protein F4801DRAFT_584492 [Xylaria longipes]